MHRANSCSEAQILSLSAKLVLIQQDLWAPCYKQQAEARESQPSRSNDSTLPSAMRCQHEGCHPYLFWLVSINLWETKRGGFPGLRLCAEWPDHSVAWHALCCFSCTDRSLTSSFWSAHVGFSVKTSQGSQETIFEPNLPYIRNDLPLLSLSAPTKSITRQIIYGNENSLFPLSLLPYSESRRPTRPPSLLEHLIQGLKAKTNVASMQLGLYVLH